MAQEGPILTVQDASMIPGNPNDLRGDQSTAFDGVPGYPKGSGGKIPEVTFVNQGAFTAPKPASKG
jgi:hypothetical protein